MIQACRIIQNPNYGLTMSGDIFDIKTGKKISLEETDILIGKEELFVSNWYGNESWLKSHNDIKNLKYYAISEKIVMIHETMFSRIPNFSNYVISKSGTVVSLRRKKIMKRRMSENGYFSVHITNDSGKSKVAKVHRLVMSTYIGECPIGYVTDHLDGNKFNPSLDNLEYVTYAENTRRSLNMGLQKNKVWDTTEVELLCKMLQDGMPNSVIEETFSYKGLDHRSIIMIIHLVRSRKYFKEISKDYDFPKVTYLNKKDSKLSSFDVIHIREDERSNSELSNIYGVSTSTISKIRKGNTFKYVE